MSDALLQVEGLRAGFGSNTVLHGVSFAVAPGEIAGIFGLNGAGKSVTMKVLAGVVPAWSGTVHFDGHDITTLAAEKRVGLGMGHVPQGRQVFPALTVEENIRLGAYVLRRRDRNAYADRLAEVFDMFPRLAERRIQAAGTLSGGEQAALAVARALVNRPKLLLVDEPSAGLAPVIVSHLREILRTVAQTGVTMVLVEQNVTFGLSLATTAHILQVGAVVHSGPAADIDNDTLARHLGIGRMLTSTIRRAVLSAGSGADAPDPADRTTAPAKKATRKKAAPAKKAAAAKKVTAVKKTAVKKKTAAKTATAVKKTAVKKTAVKKTAVKKTAGRTRS